LTLLSSLFERRARTEGPYKLSDAGVTSVFSIGANNPSGVYVDEVTALNSTDVFACVRILSESISSMPFPLYKRDREGNGRQRAEEHPLYPLLHDFPNPEMTSQIWREAVIAHIALWGNHYSAIRRSGDGSIKEIRPLMPWQVTPERVRTASGRRGEIVYRIARMNGDEDLPNILRAEEVFHIPGLSYNGIVGLSVIQANRDSVGLSLAMTKQAGAFFGNGSMPGGILKHDKALSKDAKVRLRESWEQAHQGPDNAARVGVLDGGLTYQAIGIPPQDAQFLEQRRFQLEQIARMYRVPLVLLQDQEKSTSWGSGIEQIMIGFVSHALTPYATRIEAEVSRKLLNDRERRRFYAEHNFDALLRGDFKTRMEARSIEIQWGIKSRDEIRKMDNMPATSDGLGYRYILPANMVFSDQLGKQPAGSALSSSQDPNASQKSSPRSLLEPILRQQFGEIVGRASNAIRAGFEKRDAAEFLEWIVGYCEDLPAHLIRMAGKTMESALGAAGASDPEGESGRLAAELADRARLEIEEALRLAASRDIDSRGAISLLLATWEQRKAQEWADQVFATEVEHERAA